MRFALLLTLMFPCLLHAQELVRRAPLTPLEGAPQGTLRLAARDGVEWLSVIAVGLRPGHGYGLRVDERVLAHAEADLEGTLEFQLNGRGLWSAGRVQVLDGQGAVVLEARLSPLVRVPDITVEGGKSASVQIVFDEPEEGLALALACSRGNFVTLQAATVVASPRETDVGQVSCQLTITDRFGLSSSAGFTVTVLAPNRPPILSTIPDQTVRAGTRRSLQVQASDPNDLTGAGLRFALIDAPDYVALSDNGGGNATLLLAPAVTDTRGGRVVVQVSEPDGLQAQSAFQITLQPAVVILDVSRPAGKLILNGLGFGATGARVSVNGQDVSSRIIGQSDRSITLAGGLKRLNLKRGANQIQMRAGTTASNVFVFSL